MNMNFARAPCTGREPYPAPAFLHPESKPAMKLIAAAVLGVCVLLAFPARGWGEAPPSEVLRTSEFANLISHPPKTMLI